MNDFYDTESKRGELVGIAVTGFEKAKSKTKCECGRYMTVILKSSTPEKTCYKSTCECGEVKWFSEAK